MALACSGGSGVQEAAHSREPVAAPDSGELDPLEGLTPEDWEEMARRRPPCDSALAPSRLVAHPWRVESLGGSLRLPPDFRLDIVPLEGVAQRWVAPDSSAIELSGTEALLGLAISGDIGRPEPQGSCGASFLGRHAQVDRFQLIRRADTLHVAQINTLVRPRAGVSAMLFTRSAGRLRELMAALRLATVDK